VDRFSGLLIPGHCTGWRRHTSWRGCPESVHPEQRGDRPPHPAARAREFLVWAGLRDTGSGFD